VNSAGQETMEKKKAGVARIDHIQIAAPEGCEPAARKFFGSILGMNEIENRRPCALAEGVGSSAAISKSISASKPNFGPIRKPTPPLPCSTWIIFARL
jgi:hypothetical protein